MIKKQRRKAWRRFVPAVLLVCMLAGCAPKFDAGAYVQAELNLTFQGDTTKAVEYGDETAEALKERYKQNIYDLIHNLTAGFAMDGMTEAQYMKLGEAIFGSMRYKVESVKKIDRTEYQVVVEYQAADLFDQALPKFEAVAKEIQEKAEKGIYEGDAEAVGKAVQKEYVRAVYNITESSYHKMDYGEKETEILTVVRNEKKEFELAEGEISDFIAKILHLDEIQG